MRERLSTLIGSAGYKVAIHTFHGFAREIIASRNAMPKGKSVMDELRRGGRY